jgi:hypothetical protein
MKRVEEELLLATRNLHDKNKILKAFCTKELYLMVIFKAGVQVIDQQALTKVVADVAYDLFHQFVCGKA